MHIEFSFSIIQKINASFLHLGRCTSTHLDVRGLVRFYTLRNGLEAVVPIYQTVSHLKSNFPWRHHEITDIFSPSSLPCQSPQDKYHNSKPFQATISWHADDIWPDLFFSPKPNSRSHARARFFFFFNQCTRQHSSVNSVQSFSSLCLPPVPPQVMGLAVQWSMVLRACLSRVSALCCATPLFSVFLRSIWLINIAASRQSQALTFR